MRHALALTLEKLRAVWPTTLKSRFGWAFFASLVSVLLIVMFTPVGAQVTEAGNWLITGLAQILLAVANLSIGMCIFFLRFFIAIASYNNYIDVDVVQLGWVMVRDVANMFFVVALLVIAFGTILGLEEYEWKKNLVKLIFAAIFINFSNLIAQLFIDVAHVFTMTFLNAISATAGGNLINMFKLDQITQMVGVNPDVNTEFNVEILAGTAVAALFALLAAFVMGSYVYVMMARVVSLWALIILSPLAYILGVLPKTQSYAERWWSEFSNNVIVAPIMVFFLWLAFATLGTGNILASIQEDIPNNNKIDGTKSVQLVGANFVGSNEPSKISLSKVSTWENMANFLIALAFLRVGVKTTEETGVWGSDMISDAWSFGKRAATIATGVAAARWLTGKSTDTLKTGASRAFWAAPLVGGRALSNYANAAKLGIGRIQIARDNKAKDWEKTEKDLRKNEQEYQMGKKSKADFLAEKDRLHTAAGGFLGRGLRLVGASLIQTGGRADKKAEDWEKAVESQKTVREENYSTSDSAGGRAKLEWGIMAHAAEEMAGSKKREKYASGTQYILDQEAKVNGGMLTSLEQTTAAARGKAENIEYDLKRHMDLKTAKERATALQKEGRTVEANSVLQSAYANANEIESKPIMTMSFNQRVNQGGKLIEDIMASTDDGKRSQLRKNALQLLNISAQKGQEEFEAALTKMLTQLYGNDKFDITAENASTRIMEAATGVRAGSKKPDGGTYDHNSMQEIISGLYHEKEEEQAFMSIFADSLKKLATTGGVKYVGSVYERSTVGDPKATSSTKYGFVNGADANDKSFKEGQENYFADKVVTKALLNLDGYLNVALKKNAAGGTDREVTGIRPEQLDQLTAALGNFGDTREISTAFSAALTNSLREDMTKGKMSPATMTQFKELFNGLGRMYGDKGKKDDVYRQLVNSALSPIYQELIRTNQLQRGDAGFVA